MELASPAGGGDPPAAAAALPALRRARRSRPRPLCRLPRFAAAQRLRLPALRDGFVRDFLKYRVHARVAGPTEAQRAAGQAVIWGRAEAPNGRAVESRLVTPEPYNLTVLTALWVAEQVLAGHAPVGYQTPSTAYGPDWILDLPGVAREDIE